MKKFSLLNLKLIRELSHLKLQVFSIAMVVGIGVAVLFGFTSTEESLRKSRDDFYKSAQFSDLFLRIKKAPLHAVHGLESIEGVTGVETRLEYDALLSVPDYIEPAVGHIISIPDGKQPTMNQIFLKKGRLPSALSEEEIIITEGFFKAHKFELGDIFHASLNGRKRQLKIVGVGVSPEHIFSLQPGSPLPDDFHYTVIWMNESALAASFDMRSSFNSAVLKIKPDLLVEGLIAKINQQMDRFGGVGALGRDKQTSHVYVREELKQLRVQAFSIPIVFFLVAAFILNVVISRMVRSQRGEIATLKALGFFNAEISAFYYKVAFVIIGLGSLFGLMLGAWIGSSMIELYGDFYHFPTLSYSFSIKHFFIAMGVSFLTASIGVYSSLRGIFKLSPAEAMRPPVPHMFHKGLLEGSGWVSALSTRSKMIFRGVTNFPLKALMTGLGLCFSIVILVSGLFWQDCMDFLLLAQYSFVQKETGTIRMTHALSPNSVHEVRRLPGVIEAEAYRNAGVKVRHLNQEKHSVIKGLPQNPRLTGFVNRDLVELAPPTQGIFVSEILANQLKVGEGDILEVEFLEGRKPVISLKVERILEGLMNVEILTSRKILAQILKTDDLVDQILFRSFSDSTLLYTRLKQMPNVLSVSYRDSALKFFQENSARFILVFAAILSIFAGAIGFGVAFNSMRVTLSERDWELATLQILGFTVPEVFRILLGEVIFLLILFIPFGWVLGYLNAKWLLSIMSMDSFQIPFIIDVGTYFWASVILVISTAISAWVIYRLIAQSDLVATLKSRG